jgi:hypothetical protein
VRDYAYHEWDALRYRRLKAAYITINAGGGLRQVLRDLIDTPMTLEIESDEVARYESELAQLDRLNPEYKWVKQRLEAAELAKANKRCAARQAQVDELVAGWTQGKPDAIQRVNEILSKIGVSIDAAMAVTVSSHFGDIEQLDRRIAVAEARADAALQGLVRYRQHWGRVLEAKRQIDDVDYHEVASEKAKSAHD